MSEKSLKYIEYVFQYMSEMTSNYKDWVRVLYVWNEIKVRNQVKHLNISRNE